MIPLLTQKRQSEAVVGQLPVSVMWFENVKVSKRPIFSVTPFLQLELLLRKSKSVLLLLFYHLNIQVF